MLVLYGIPRPQLSEWKERRFISYSEMSKWLLTYQVLKNKEKKEAEARKASATPQPILPKPPAIPQELMKMSVIPSSLVPSPLKIETHIPYSESIPAPANPTPLPPVHTMIPSSTPKGIGSLIPTTGPASTISTATKHSTPSSSQGGLQEASENPFMGLNLPELDIFKIDFDTSDVDNTFQDIPIPDSSLDQTIMDLESIDTSSLSDFLNSDLPNPSLASQDTSSRSVSSTTTVTVNLPQSGNYRINVGSDRSSTSSSTSISGSRVVPRAQAMASATAHLDDIPSSSTQSQDSVPKRGRPARKSSNLGSTAFPMYQKKAKFQRKYQKVPLPMPPPKRLSSSSGGDTTEEEN